MFKSIKKLLKSTVLGELILIWTAPIDEKITKTSKGQLIRAGSNQKFADYIFHNIIVNQKGGNYDK